MNRSVVTVLTLSAVAAWAAPQEASKAKLKEALKDSDVHASWIYDDLAHGTALAKKEGKPLFVVLRCVP